MSSEFCFLKTAISLPEILNGAQNNQVIPTVLPLIYIIAYYENTKKSPEGNFQ